VWKEVGEPLSDRLVESTVKFGGGNVMMWGCMFWKGIGYATRIEGKMDAELYCSVLDDELQQSLNHYNNSPSNITFQQDMNPKHRSKQAEKWFADHGYTVMKWPAQSPDLNCKGTLVHTLTLSPLLSPINSYSTLCICTSTPTPVPIPIVDDICI
jgi:hypothetical protein